MNKKLKLILPLVLLVVLIIVPIFAKSSLTVMSILISVLLYMYYASAWNIMGGYTGLFSEGHGMFVGLGAYITGILYVYVGITPWIGIIIAGIMVALFSILIGFPTFRLQSIFYTLSTFAILQVFLTIFKNFKTIFGFKTGAAEGFKFASIDDPANMQFTSKVPYYYIILGLLVIIILVSYWLSHSKRGFYFRALSANPLAAASVGVNVVKMKMEAQFISAFFSAIGGGFYCMYMCYIDPSKLFGTDLSINILIMCVVGGANTLWGPILGAGIMYTINRVVTLYAADISGLANVIFGIVLMLVVFFMPGGLIPFFTQRKEEKAAAKHKAALLHSSEDGGEDNG